MRSEIILSKILFWENKRLEWIEKFLTWKQWGGIGELEIQSLMYFSSTAAIKFSFVVLVSQQSSLAMIITARKRSCGKVMFLHLSLSHSVHMGGGVYPSMQWAGKGCTSPGRQPPGQTPLGKHPLWGDTP